MIVLPRRLSDEVADRVRALIDEKNLEAPTGDATRRIT